MYSNHMLDRVLKLMIHRDICDYRRHAKSKVVLMHKP